MVAIVLKEAGLGNQQGQSIKSWHGECFDKARHQSPTV